VCRFAILVHGQAAAAINPTAMDRTTVSWLATALRRNRHLLFEPF